MTDGQRDRRKRGGAIWLLLLLVVVVAWWYFRPAPDRAATGDPAAGDAWAEADPDDILVDLRDDVGDDVVADLERTFGIDLELVSDQSADERLYRAHVAPDRRDALIAALSARPEVEVAEPDARVTLTPQPGVPVAASQPMHPGFPNDPLYRFQWHMDQIHMPAAWPLADGDGVIVAVIDTGVAHENRGRFTTMPDLDVDFVKPYDFVHNVAHANDDHGHGTHVAGTIAQSTNNGIGVAGVARKVKIMPLKVLGADGSGSVGGIADAIRYAADEGAKVINMSLGGRFPSRILKRAVQYAHSKGVVVVCAAGNDGRGKVSYPAAYPGAIAVAATQYDERTTFYSNWGAAIDLAAPGGNTRVDQNGDGMPDGVLQNTIVEGDPSRNDYLAYMGTSMASPHVAGVAALLVGEGVTDPDQVEAILKDTARKPEGYDRDRYGAGIVDAAAAVVRARTAVGTWQALLGLLLAAAVASAARRRGLGVRIGAGYVAGVLVGASGLFFLPLFGSIAAWPGMDLLSRGLPSWDLVLLGPAGHGNALFFSALIPLVLVALLASTRARAVVAGVAAGVGGHLLLYAVAPMAAIAYAPADPVWLVANAAACAGLAYLVLKR
ncbi:MAG: peptidase S8 [Deltaproteobacteria bacterium]|nr:MAG: peptidase S8 [Deltaproteobacteria bacterium]